MQQNGHDSVSPSRWRSRRADRMDLDARTRRRSREHIGRVRTRSLTPGVANLANESAAEFTKSQTLSQQPPQPSPHSSPVIGIAWCPTGRYAASAAREGRDVAVWAVFQQPTSEAQALHQQQLQQQQWEQEFARRSTKRNVASKPPSIYIALIRVLHGHTGDILALKFSHAKNFLLSASRDRTVRLWHPETAVCLRVFHHEETVTALAFHPRIETVFLAASADCQIRLWSIHDTHCLARIPTNGVVTCAAFSAGTRADRLVLGTYSGVLEVYEAVFDAGQQHEQEQKHAVNSAVSHKMASTEVKQPNAAVSPTRLQEQNQFSNPSQPSGRVELYAKPKSTVGQPQELSMNFMPMEGEAPSRADSARLELLSEMLSDSALVSNGSPTAALSSLRGQFMSSPSPSAGVAPPVNELASSGAVRFDPYPVIARVRSPEFSFRMLARVNTRSGRSSDVSSGPVRVGHKVSGLAIDPDQNVIVALCDDSHACTLRLDDLTPLHRQRGPNINVAASSTTRAALSLDGRRAVTGADAGLHIFRVDSQFGSRSRDRREIRKEQSKRRCKNGAPRQNFAKDMSLHATDINTSSSLTASQDLVTAELTASGGSDTDPGLATSAVSGKDRRLRRNQKAASKRPLDKASLAHRPVVVHPLCTLAGRSVKSKISASAIAPPCLQQQISLGPEDTLLLIGLGNGGVVLNVFSGGKSKNVRRTRA